MANNNQNITLESLWESCEKPFQDIFVHLNKGLNNQTYMAIYTIVYNYCSSQNDGVLKDFYPKIENLLASKAAEIIKGADDLTDYDLLLYFRNKWNDWKFSAKVLKNWLEPVNRIYASDNSSRSTPVSGTGGPSQSSPPQSKIMQDGLNAWKKAAFDKLNNKLSASLLKIIQNDREDRDSSNLQVLADTLECYVQLGPEKNKLEVYQQYFEARFLSETEKFYKVESLDYVAKNGIPGYMKHISKRVEEERARVQKFMHSASTLDKLDPLLNQTLIIDYKEEFANKFLDLLTENKEEELTMMYNLLLRVDHLETLRVKLQEFIKIEGLKEIEKDLKEAQEKPQVLVKILLEIWNRFNRLIKNCFNNDSRFHSAMDQSFSIVINNNPASYDERKKESNIPVVLSKFCDQILRKGPYHISDEAELEVKLSEAVCLFRYLPDKDIFMLNYQKMLSKRLVEDLSASEDAEASMINKLKAHQGFDYCTKLTRMINDMRLCKDINTNFQNYLNDQGLTLPYTFNFYVLTNGSWSLSNKTSTTPFKPPTEMLPSLTYFEKFYKSSYKGRVLTFLYDFSRADVDSRQVKGKVYKLTTTAYQMAVLLMLNSSDKITRFQILDTIGLDENTIRLPLLSLIKIGVIESDNADYKSWTNDTTFSVNPKFTSKKMKVNCNIAVQIGETKTSEGAQTVSQTEIEKERYFKLQAAIVRIMKSKKVLSHNDLVVETTSQVSKWFTPKIPTIKKAIEYLIDQEYIKRTSDDNQNQRKYEYIA
ncbi:cullin E [Heterostelium album PN500]|uniref:Cullin-5 n=1 Tax=Heterostelium pallidum (strain ATCC 26659 / Pp 5 / PN500) TaxID=670386 RepID=D3B027_HETP5|nr:cullin E [Heterostelium album PN500]EFA84651.1 cullin E [Heterostelium album PN500]|eukprot:XP_020436764.1 cullin E [Heterostelium album PN500]